LKLDKVELSALPKLYTLAKLKSPSKNGKPLCFSPDRTACLSSFCKNGQEKALAFLQKSE
jgi:hypothetical protein